MTEETLFHQALALPPGERAAFLDRVCADQPELRAAVAALLAEAERSGNPLDAPPDFGATVAAEPIRDGQLPETTDAPDISPATVIAGRYALVQKLGEGGMGEVWVAKQTEPVKRKVALKLIKPGMDSKAVVQRFEQERQALALMDHPNIARVLDGGLTDERRPFFVMELVNGLPLTRYCDEAKLDIRQRLELFVPICQAVQHAHQKGIVHRDLKPANILVTLIDGRPVPKVIDFGVAKATSGKLTDESLSTQFGAVVGTLEYMAPEQAGYSGDDIDTRADIYSLGVLLYELLTGLRPLDAKRLQQAALPEMIRIIKEEEPSKPSTRLSTDKSAPSLAAVRHTEPKRLAALLRGELDWVVMKCLEKDRNRRYETANGLARDIQRYLADELVEARPPSTGYRLRKFLRRNKGPAAAAAAVALALLGGAAGTTAAMFRAQEASRSEATRAESEAHERRRAEVAVAEALRQEQEAIDKLALATAVTNFLQNDLLAQASSLAQADRDFEPDPDLTVRVALDRAAAAVGKKFADRPKVEAGIHHTIGVAYRQVGAFAQAIDEFQRAVELRTGLFGPDHSDTLNSRNSLGVAYSVGGRYADSVRVLEQLRADLVRLDHPRGPHLLDVTSNLARSYQQVGRFQDAVRLYEEVVAARTRELGPDHHKTLIASNGLSQAYGRLGRDREGIAILERISATAARTLGPDHPDTLTMTYNLGLAYANHGRPRDALGVMERVRDGQRKTLGPNHPGTLTTLTQLGGVYSQVGRTAEAIAVLEEARDRRTQKLGPEHPAVQTTLAHLATAHWRAKQYERSVPLFEQILATRQRLLGEQHPDTLQTRANLGVNYRDAGRAAEAIPHLEQVYRDGQKFPTLRWVGQELVSAYTAANRRADALDLLQKLLMAARAQHPAGSAALARALAETGGNLLKLSAFAEAEPVLREALTLRERLNPDDWGTFNSRAKLGEALFSLKKYAEAEPLLLAGFQGMKQRAAAIPPAGQARLREAAERLARLYEEVGKPAEAAKWRKEAGTLNGAK